MVSWDTEVIFHKQVFVWCLIERSFIDNSALLSCAEIVRLLYETVAKIYYIRVIILHNILFVMRK